MEKQLQLTNNGQQIVQDDVDLLGETSALADDRVYAELFRLTPFDGSNVGRGILRYAHQTSGPQSLIVANGASGSVKVRPFRAVVGSRTAVGTDARKDWRDIRSGLSVAEGGTTLETTVNFAANSSGNPRWDAVYAAVSPDADGASVVRKVKDPITGALTSPTVVINKVTSVALGVQAGTPSATPDWPSIPSDGGGVYYILLGYVRIPNGFNGTATVLAADIAVQAPVLELAESNGAPTWDVADQSHNPTSAQIETWGSTGTRPTVWMPPTMSGGKKLIVALDLNNSAPSHASGATVDSRNWLDRIVTYFAAIGAAGSNFAWAQSAGIALPVASSDVYDRSLTNGQLAGFGIGATMGQDLTTTRPCAYVAAPGGHGQYDTGTMNPGATVTLYADPADGGKLKVSYSGAPNCSLLFVLDFSGVYENHPFDGF